MKELYDEEPELSPIIGNYKRRVNGTCSTYDGFLFKGNILYALKSSFEEELIQEADGGGLAGHFKIFKTFEVLQEYFHWLNMNGDAHAIISKCSMCERAKSHFHQGFYNPLPVLT